VDPVPQPVKRAGLILLLTEKLIQRDHDEHSQIDILTSGSNLAPAFPADPVALGVCHPLQWRNRPRFTRGSLIFGCNSRTSHFGPVLFKEHPIVRREI
jgi:hypothetical protein